MVKKVVMLIEGGLMDSVFDNLYVEIKIIVDKIEQMFYSMINQNICSSEKESFLWTRMKN